MFKLRPMRYYWHVHHERLVEAELEPIQNRKDYIVTRKPTNEVKLRLHLLRRATNLPQIAREDLKNGFALSPEIYPATFDQVIKLHAEQCDPNCPWVPAVWNPYYGNILTNTDSDGNYWLKPEV